MSIYSRAKASPVTFFAPAFLSARAHSLKVVAVVVMSSIKRMFFLLRSSF